MLLVKKEKVFWSDIIQPRLYRTSLSSQEKSLHAERDIVVNKYIVQHTVSY